MCWLSFFRNQEKGVLAKGVSVESSVTAKEAKNSQGHWPQQYIWHSEHHSQERRMFCKNPLPKTPFSWLLNYFCMAGLLLPELATPTHLYSEERQKPQPPLLLQKYRNTPPICIAIRLQFVLEYFQCPYALRKGSTVSTPPICIAVRPPFVLRYASHLYRSTFGKILVVVGTGMFPID